jgi:hypothetical protein
LEEDEEDKGKKCWDDTENAIFPNDKHIPTPPIRYWEEGWHISIQADCKAGIIYEETCRAWQMLDAVNHLCHEFEQL